MRRGLWVLGGEVGIDPGQGQARGAQGDLMVLKYPRAGQCGSSCSERLRGQHWSSRLRLQPEREAKPG